MGDTLNRSDKVSKFFRKYIPNSTYLFLKAIIDFFSPCSMWFFYLISVVGCSLYACWYFISFRNIICKAETGSIARQEKLSITFYKSYVICLHSFNGNIARFATSCHKTRIKTSFITRTKKSLTKIITYGMNKFCRFCFLRCIFDILNFFSCFIKKRKLFSLLRLAPLFFKSSFVFIIPFSWLILSQIGLRGDSKCYRKREKKNERKYYFHSIFFRTLFHSGVCARGFFILSPKAHAMMVPRTILVMSTSTFFIFSFDFLKNIGDIKNQNLLYVRLLHFLYRLWDRG